MESIINNEILLQPSTFRGETFVSTVINEMGFNDVSASNLITNLNSLFTRIQSFTTTGVTLATDITKAKSAAYSLSLFGSVLNVGQIAVQILTASIGVLEQPTISDVSNVVVETDTTETIINTITYTSSVVPIGASLTLPSYYDHHSNSITVTIDSDNLSLIHI